MVSEAVLLAIYAGRLLPAAPASILATLAGVPVSYMLSRHWIWPDAVRERPTAQLFKYVLISAVGMAASALATWQAGRLSILPSTWRVIAVGSAYLLTYGALSIAKYLVYQKAVFRTDRVKMGRAAYPGDA